MFFQVIIRDISQYVGRQFGLAVNKTDYETCRLEDKDGFFKNNFTQYFCHNNFVSYHSKVSR